MTCVSTCGALTIHRNSIKNGRYNELLVQARNSNVTISDNTIISSDIPILGEQGNAISVDVDPVLNLQGLTIVNNEVAIGSERRWLMSVSGINGVVIDNNDFHGGTWGGLYLANTQGVAITDTRFTGAPFQYGIYVASNVHNLCVDESVEITNYTSEQHAIADPDTTSNINFNASCE
jgi:hypothetical protein